MKMTEISLTWVEEVELTFPPPLEPYDDSEFIHETLLRYGIDWLNDNQKHQIVEATASFVGDFCPGARFVDEILLVLSVVDSTGVFPYVVLIDAVASTDAVAAETLTPYLPLLAQIVPAANNTEFVAIVARWTTMRLFADDVVTAVYAAATAGTDGPRNRAPQNKQHRRPRATIPITAAAPLAGAGGR